MGTIASAGKSCSMPQKLFVLAKLLAVTTTGSFFIIVGSYLITIIVLATSIYI